MTSLPFVKTHPISLWKWNEMLCMNKMSINTLWLTPSGFHLFIFFLLFSFFGALSESPCKCLRLGLWDLLWSFCFRGDEELKAERGDSISGNRAPSLLFHSSAQEGAVHAAWDQDHHCCHSALLTLTQVCSQTCVLETQ